MSDLALPTIHLNGSGASNLFRGYTNALKAIREAREALNATSPHPRDYYVSDDPTAYANAREQHYQRMKGLETLEQDLEALQIHVFENNFRKENLDG